MNRNIQEAIKKAREVIDQLEIDDIELKKIAFSKAIDYFLVPKEYKKEPKKTEIFEEEKPKKNFWNQLSNKSDIEIERLKDIYTIKDGQIYLIIRELRGEVKAEQQRSLALLILYGYQEGLSKNWVSSSLLAEAAERLDLYDKSKFAKTVGRHLWFRTRGETRGREYKLSTQGLKEAQNYLRKLSKA